MKILSQPAGGAPTVPDYHMILNGTAIVPYTGGASQQSGYVSIERTSNTQLNFVVSDVDISNYKYCEATFDNFTGAAASPAMTVGADQITGTGTSGTMRINLMQAATSPANITLYVYNNNGSYHVTSLKLTNTEPV